MKILKAFHLLRSLDNKIMKNKKALEIFDLFKNNPQKLQDELILLFKNKNLKIKKICLFKKHWVIKNQWKVSALVNLENNVPEKIILEIHDNIWCFKRVIFALTILSKTIIQPTIFKKIDKPKIIIREFSPGDNFYKIINEKNLSLKKIIKINKKIAAILSYIHSLKLNSLPKFLFKKMNKEMEKKTLQKIFQFLTPEMEIFREKLETNFKIFFKKMSELDGKNMVSLIHSDPNLSHFILRNDNVCLIDFDTLETGNPAKDLGKFIFDLKYYLRKKYSPKKIEGVINSFLKEYFKKKKIILKPNLESNLAVHQAERLAYILLSKIWERKNLTKEELQEIKELLAIQQKLLNLNY